MFDRQTGEIASTRNRNRDEIEYFARCTFVHFESFFILINKIFRVVFFCGYFMEKQILFNLSGKILIVDFIKNIFFLFLGISILRFFSVFYFKMEIIFLNCTSFTNFTPTFILVFFLMKIYFLKDFICE